MAILNIVKTGDDILKKKSRPVEKIDERVLTLLDDMKDTLYKANGAGLAAPQVGKLLRLFVLQADDEIRRVFINPQIIATSAETCEYEEGCLSIPKAYETIVRPAKVTVQALNENGKPFTLEADGFLARIIQHEYDHLDGFLYIDRGDEETKQRIIETFNRRKARKAEKERLKAKKAAKIANKNSKQG